MIRTRFDNSIFFFCICSFALYAGGTCGADEVAFNEAFPADYEDAKVYLSKNYDVIVGILSENGADSDVLVPVVFPEIMRYSIVRDTIEITGLKIFYVHVGGKFANFSIGRFQMKPSFAEGIEIYILSYADEFPSLSEKIQYSEMTDGKELRRSRVKRLEQLEWQILYLACFGLIIEHRFNNVAWNSREEQIRFFATAYNHGFMSHEAEIRQWQHAALYPYGVDAGPNQYAYGDLSVFFFRNDWQTLKHSFSDIIVSGD